MNKTIDDARWSCQSCGACCRGFSFGPVEPHVIAGLQEKKIEEHWAPAQKEWHVQNPKTGEFFFTHVDGHCIFLQEDNRCAIHARFGSKAKPWFCREYPFHVVEDPQGLNITIREDCGGAHKSFLSGEKINEQLEELFSIERIVPRQKFSMEQVVILPGLGVSIANWLQVEPVLIQKCEEDLCSSIRSMRNALFSMAGRQGPAADQEQYIQRCMQLKTFLLEQFRKALVPESMRSSQEFLCCSLEEASGELLGTSEVESYFVYVCKNRMLGKSFARLGSFPAGMGLLLLEHHLFAGKGELALMGPKFSRWRRALMLQPFWNIVRQSAQGFVHLFMLV